VTNFSYISFCLNNSTNLSFLKFYFRLRSARSLRFGAIYILFPTNPPNPFSSSCINDTKAMIIDLIFQDALQVYLWKCVKVVHIDLLL